MTCCLLLDVKFKFPPWSPSLSSPVPLTRVRQTQALCLCHWEQDNVFHQQAFVLTNLIWNWGHSSLSTVLLLRERIFPFIGTSHRFLVPLILIPAVEVYILFYTSLELNSNFWQFIDQIKEINSFIHSFCLKKYAHKYIYFREIILRNHNSHWRTQTD